MFSFDRRLLWPLLAGLLVAMMLLTATPNVGAKPTSSTTPYAVQRAEPAVVRIITTLEGTITLKTDSEKITFPLNGGTYGWVFSGSGALIGPDGYVLTADHVVEYAQNDPYIEGLFFQSLIEDKSLGKSLGVSQEKVTQFFNQYKDQLSYSYEVTKQQVFLSTAYTGKPLQSVSDTISYEARHLNIVSSSPPDQQDVAIFKVETSNNDLPYLTLAQASSIHVQDNVTAIAFPGDAETASFLALTDTKNSNASDLTQLLTPSVENGQVTKEGSLNGTTVYETSNIAGAGSSGGPVINSQGQIIGFVDAASSNQRVVFLIPSEVISTWTRKAGMPLLTGAFMSLWDRAIREYYASGACHWTKAYQDLKQLHEKYPKFGGIEPFLKEAQVQATPSECPPPPPPASSSPLSNWPLLAGLGASVVLLGGIGSFFVIQRRKKTIPQATSATTSTSVGTMSTDELMPDNIADRGQQSGEIATPTQASLWSEPTPAIRKCISGHVVTTETAHFCPECGAPIEEPRESKVLQGQT